MSSPITFVLPDFFSQCPYQPRVNPLTEGTALNTERWVLSTLNYDDCTRQRFLKTKGGILAGYCYPDAEPFQFQVVSDFIEWLFCFDDFSDEFTAEENRTTEKSIIDCLRKPYHNAEKSPICLLIEDILIRFNRSAGSHCAQRFTTIIADYLQGVTRQAAYRDEDKIPDVESYVALRRATSGVRPSFVLIEFAAGIDLPSTVIEHPIIQSMETSVNDWVSWTNDIISYKKEQAAGDTTHNLVSIIMSEHHLDLQTAIDRAEDMCLDSLRKFEECRQDLPSWGPSIDDQVQCYIQGLQYWIVGSLYWSFVSGRYFVSDGQELMQNRLIQLNPRILPADNETCVG